MGRRRRADGRPNDVAVNLPVGVGKVEVGAPPSAGLGCIGRGRGNPLSAQDHFPMQQCRPSMDAMGAEK